MPIIGMILGGIDFTNLSITVGSANIAYGMFIQNVLDFLVVAFCVFIFVKIVNNLAKLGHKKETTNIEVSTETELSILKDIRDELAKRKTTTKTKKKV